MVIFIKINRQLDNENNEETNKSDISG